MTRPKKGIDIPDIPGYKAFDIKLYLIVIVILFLFSIIFTTFLKPERILKAPPQVSVGITTAYQDFYQSFSIFGYGDYSDQEGNPELNSQYKWYKNNQEIESGTLSKVFLNHFETSDLESEEGYSPITNVSIVRVSGKYGQGVEIKDTGDKLSYQIPNGFNINSGTIEMWVKPYWNSGSDNPDYYIYSQDGDSNNYIKLRHSNGGRNLKIDFLSNGELLTQNVVKTVTWKPNEWHHIAIVIKNRNPPNVIDVRFYVDGQSSFIGTGWPLALQPYFYLGSQSDGNNPFNGVIDEVRLHNRNLSSDEVYESFILGREYHSNEQMLDLSSFNPGDKIKFQYTPCNANDGCGTAITSSEVTVQQFTPTITIDANNELRPFNRNFMGHNTGYDNRSLNAGAGYHIWDSINNRPNPTTLNYASQLAPAGLSRVWPTPTMYNNNPEGSWSWPPTTWQMEELIENMIEFASQAGISAAEPGIAPYLITLGHNHDQPPYSGDLIPLGSPNNNNGCPYNSLYPTYEQGWSDVLDYINNQQGLNVKYWEVLGEPYGFKTAEEIACEANTYAEAMKQVDPSIRIIVPVAEGEIDQLLNSINPDLVDDIQFHFYQGRYMYDYQAGQIISECYNTNQQLDQDFVIQEIYPHTVGGSVEHATELSKFFRNKLDLKYPSYNKKIHLDEWSVQMNFWPSSYPDLSDYCYAMYQSAPTLMGAIARSALRNTVIKDGLVDSLMQFDFGYMNSDWAFIQLSGTGVLTNYLDNKIYSDYIGDIVLNDNTETLMFDSSGDDVHTYDVENNPSLSVLATKSNDGTKLYLLVVNREVNKDITTQINLQNFIPQLVTRAELDVRVQSNLEVLESVCTGPLYFPSGSCDNSRITIETSNIPADTQFTYTFPSHSITGFEFSGSGQTNCDVDNDGYLSNSLECNGNDCNDNDPNINPGAQEICDGINNDCDTQTDEGCEQDITPPTINLVNPTLNQVLPAGTTSTTINITTDEISICRYSTNPSLITWNDMLAFPFSNSTNHSRTRTSLSDGNTYYEYFLCEDSLGNRMTETTNLTFSVASPAPPTDTNGGGGGGGGRGSNEGEAEAEAEAESEQITEQTIDVNLFDNQELTITSQLQQLVITVDNINEHVMQILSITDNQIAFTLENEQYTLSIGESKVFTLDGVNIEISLNSITNGNAYLTFKRPQELPLPTKIKGKILPNLSIIIPLVIIIVIITLIILKKEKSHLKARARIYTLRKKGYNDNQIKDMFKKKGWSEQTLENLFEK